MRRTAIGLITLCGVLFLAQGATTQAVFDSFYDPCSLTALASNEPLTTSDIKTTFGVGIDPSTCGRFAGPQERPSDWLTASRIDFTPWRIPRDNEVPDGTKVGEYKSEVVLGIVNNGCNTILNVNFDLLDATIDRRKTIDPRPIGKSDRLRPLAEKGADGVPAAATKWPSYLTAYAESVGMDLSLLRARMVAVNTTSVTGTAVVWNFLSFRPGARLSAETVVDPALGWPTVAIFQDPMSRGSAEDPITDWCAPLWSEQTLFGTVGADITFRKNPSDGVYNFTTYSMPAPDADYDGIENSLDPCPYAPNASGWSPRSSLVRDVTIGDPDVDGLPDNCDPHPSLSSACNSEQGSAHSDEDCDGWANRGDNCPLVVNDDQMDADRDGIGDSCDTSMSPNGTYGPVCSVSTALIGTGGPPPVDPQALSPCNVYFCECSIVGGNVDCDGDVDASDLLLTMGLLTGAANPPCAEAAYRGCDYYLLDMGDIIVMLRYVALHQAPVMCPVGPTLPQ